MHVRSEESSLVVLLAGKTLTLFQLSYFIESN